MDGEYKGLERRPSAPLSLLRPLSSQWSPRVFSAFKGGKRGRKDGGTRTRRGSSAFKSPLIDTEFIASKEQPGETSGEERRRESLGKTEGEGADGGMGKMKENGRIGSDERGPGCAVASL